MDQPLPAPDPSIPPVPSSSPSPVSTPPHVSYVPKLLVVAILFLTLGLGAGFTLNNYLSTPNPTPSLVATTSPSPAPDPTANWKTYTNSQLGFTFLYPQTLDYVYDQISNYTEKGNNSGNLLIQNFDGLKFHTENPSDFQIAIFVSKYSGVPLKVETQQGETHPKTYLKIGGEDGLKGIDVQKNKEIPAAWVVHNGILYTFQLSTPLSASATNFDQILSTFKFGGQTSDISSWKTFSQKELLPVSFKYPGTLFINMRGGDRPVITVTIKREEIPSMFDSPIAPVEIMYDLNSNDYAKAVELAKSGYDPSTLKKEEFLNEGTKSTLLSGTLAPGARGGERFVQALFDNGTKPAIIFWYEGYMSDIKNDSANAVISEEIFNQIIKTVRFTQ